MKNITGLTLAGKFTELANCRHFLTIPWKDSNNEIC